ncbi:MAG TPA: fibronectin type III domain-containing protein [Candidatus Acidoferrum sp.]|nr:fibronectin type III domain-containing protein [Candidatus Acidoferrum sp.]
MRHVKLSVIVALFFGCLAGALLMRAPAALAFSGSGAGTPLNPYKITTCAQLEEVSNSLAANYKLASSIDCSASMFTPIGSFSGTFDGGFNTISGVSAINLSGDHIGVFSFLAGATVSNLTISDSSVEGLEYVGVLAGGTNGFGSVDHVAITDSNAMGGAFIGGLLGSMFQFSVSDSHTSNTTVNGENNSGLTDEIGGIAGEVNWSDVARTYVLGGGVTGNIDDPTQSQYIGGFAGDDGNGSTVTDSYSTANVTGHNYVGGFSGRVNDTAYATSYASGNVAGDNFVGGFTGGLYGGVLTDTFATGHVTGLISGGLVGITDAGSPGQIISGAWDVTRSVQANCVGDLQISITCTGANVAGAAPNYFFNNHTNAPLNTWDFTNLWRTNSADYPSFQTVPAALSDARITPAATSLTIAFGQADNGGSVLTSYELQWGPSGGSLADISGISPTTVTYTLNNLSTSTAYALKVRAINAKGAGEWTTLNATTLAAIAANNTSHNVVVSPPAKTISQPIITASSASAGETTTAPTPEVAAPAPGLTPATLRSPSASKQTNSSPNPSSSSFNFAWLLVIPSGIVLVWLGVAIFGKTRP